MILQTENLTIVRNQQAVISDLNFMLDYSEKVVLQGEIGSGKSSFLLLRGPFMKNAIVKFSLTALAAFTLAACGSSGGSSDNTAAPSNATKTPVKSDDTAKAK